MNDTYKNAAMKLIDPMLDALKAMDAEELCQAMEGFYQASDDNCPWEMTAFKSLMPPFISLCADLNGIDLIEYRMNKPIQ